MSDRPLDGLRVLDFSHVLAGPFATRMLADMGADVVRVNSAKRATGANDPSSAYYVSFNRNKRSLALDMSREESRPIARELADRADVVIDNFSPGVLDRWGIGYEEVRNRNPGVIYIEMSGMGDNGPWSKFVTFAPTIHALAGLSYLTGVPGRQDIGIGFSYNDHQAGLHGAVAILAALETRRRNGRGQRIDVSQFELGVNFAGPSLLDLAANKNVAEPAGNRLPYDDAAPHGCYRCQDDATRTEDEQWIAIACLSETHWQSLRTVMGNPQWSQEAELTTVSGRQNSSSLDASVESWTRTLPAQTIMLMCQEAGVPAGVVQSAIDLNERDPQLAHNGFIREMDQIHRGVGRMNYDRLAIRFLETPCDRYDLPSLLGEDNAAVLADWLGMDEAEIRSAEQQGLLT